MSNSGWRKAALAAMTYDRGRLTLGNTGNKYLNMLGGAAILRTNE